jgi:uncharacterized membrane protein YphA (DoxX/SURF4 family)
VVCGALILLGLCTRLAAVPLLISIPIAILSTKIPISFGHGFAGFYGSEAAARFADDATPLAETTSRTNCFGYFRRSLAQT